MSELVPVRTVAPTVTPISVSECWQQCRVDTNDEDEFISGLIDAAVSHIEGPDGLGRALISQTWRQDFAEFDDCLRLPIGDLLAVTSVTYYDADNAIQTLSTDVYAAFTDASGPFIELKTGQSWPTIYDRRDAVRVTWTAGYGVTAASVPAALRHALKMLVGHWFENREASVIGATAVEVPLGVQRLLAPYRRQFC